MKRIEVSILPLPEPGMHENPYNVQNDLLRSCNFPVAVYTGEKFGDLDIYGDVYSDRLPNWNDFLDKIRCSFDSFHHWVNNSSKKRFLGDIQLLVNKICDFQRRKVTGARIIRYTNVSTGYPVYRIDFVAKHPETPEEEVDLPYGKIQKYEMFFFDMKEMTYWDGQSRVF